MWCMRTNTYYSGAGNLCFDLKLAMQTAMNSIGSSIPFWPRDWRANNARLVVFWDGGGDKESIVPHKLGRPPNENKFAVRGSLYLEHPLPGALQSFVWKKSWMAGYLWTDALSTYSASATRQTTYFCTWLIASFPLLIRCLLPYLEAWLLFIHDMASISTYFSLFSTFSYRKALEKAQKSIFPWLWCCPGLIRRAPIMMPKTHCRVRGLWASI